MVRSSVQWFAERMEDKLRQNDHKGDWGHFSDFELLRGMMDEIDEMLEAMMEDDGDEHIIDECADVANWVHFIADIARRRQSIDLQYNGVDGSTGEDISGSLLPEGFRGKYPGGDSTGYVD